MGKVSSSICPESSKHCSALLLTPDEADYGGTEMQTRDDLMHVVASACMSTCIRCTFGAATCITTENIRHGPPRKESFKDIVPHGLLVVRLRKQSFLGGPSPTVFGNSSMYMDLLAPCHPWPASYSSPMSDFEPLLFGLQR